MYLELTILPIFYSHLDEITHRGKFLPEHSSARTSSPYRHHSAPRRPHHCAQGVLPSSSRPLKTRWLIGPGAIFSASQQAKPPIVSSAQRRSDNSGGAGVAIDSLSSEADRHRDDDASPRLLRYFPTTSPPLPLISALLPYSRPDQSVNFVASRHPTSVAVLFDSTRCYRIHHILTCFWLNVRSKWFGTVTCQSEFISYFIYCGSTNFSAIVLALLFG
ncbi:hypothetical protein Aduo_010137 [Ancylostoma duodenale]